MKIFIMMALLISTSFALAENLRVQVDSKESYLDEIYRIDELLKDMYACETRISKQDTQQMNKRCSKLLLEPTDDFEAILARAVHFGTKDCMQYRSTEGRNKCLESMSRIGEGIGEDLPMPKNKNIDTDKFQLRLKKYFNGEYLEKFYNLIGTSKPGTYVDLYRRKDGRVLKKAHGAQ